jgi:hypothetical protein
MAYSNNSNRSNNLVVPQAREAMENFKMQAANQVGVDLSQDPGNNTSRQNGSVGGQMVKQMIAQAEQNIAGGSMPQ